MLEIPIPSHKKSNRYIYTTRDKSKEETQKEKGERKEVCSVMWDKVYNKDLTNDLNEQHEFISVLCLLSLEVARYVTREVAKTNYSDVEVSKLKGL